MYLEEKVDGRSTLKQNLNIEYLGVDTTKSDTPVNNMWPKDKLVLLIVFIMIFAVVQLREKQYLSHI